MRTKINKQLATHKIKERHLRTVSIKRGLSNSEDDPACTSPYSRTTNSSTPSVFPLWTPCICLLNWSNTAEASSSRTVRNMYLVLSSVFTHDLATLKKDASAYQTVADMNQNILRM